MQENLMSVEIVPFSDGHLEEAAALVASRYRAARDLDKSLPARFEDSNATVPLLRDYAKKGAGVAAIREGQVVGFLITLYPLIRGVRTAYVPDWGHAADSTGRREIYRVMYANLARRWVANGYFAHAVTLLAHEHEAMDAWFSLGFGQIEIDAIRDLSAVKGAMAEVEIRRAQPEDIDVVLTLRLAMARYLATAPVFIPLMVERGRDFYEQLLSDSANAFWLAYRDGDVVAFMQLVPSSRLGLLMPVSDRTTVTITGAFTKEDVRCHGIGAALLNHSLDWARSAGYKHCAVEFESTNTIGSSFWWGRGFRPVCYSLRRHIDERIAWADDAGDDADFLQGL